MARDKQFTKKLSLCAVLVSLALIFSYVEFLVPVSVGIPGVKLGLANIVVLIALYSLGARYAFAINLVRIFLSALLFGNGFSAVYALCGGLVSFIIMLICKRLGIFSVIGVSMAGGVFHNMGQLAAAALIMKTPDIFLYFPVLLFSGMATGILTGFIGSLILPRVRQISGQ